MDLDPIQKRCEDASIEPWGWWEDAYGWVLRHGESNAVCIFDVRRMLSQQPSEADREFIAHARTDIPALLDEVEKVEAECERLRAQYKTALADVAKYQTAYARTLTELDELKAK